MFQGLGGKAGVAGEGRWTGDDVTNDEAVNDNDDDNDDGDSDPGR